MNLAVLTMVTLISALLMVPVLLRPTLLVYTLAIYIPFQEFVEKWLPGELYYAVRFGGEIAIAIALGWVILHRFSKGQGPRRSPIGLWFGLFLLAAAASAAVNGSSALAFGLGLRPLIRYVFVFYLVLNLELSPRSVEKLLKHTILAAVFVSSVALLQSMVGGPATEFLAPREVEVTGRLVRPAVRGQVGERTRVFATLGRYDTLGTFLSVMLIIGGGMFLARARGWRVLGLAIWVIGTPALLLTYSRQSWLALWVGTIALLWASKRRRASAVVGLAPLFVLGLALLVPEAIAYSSDRADVTLANRILEPFSAEYLRVSRESYGRLFVLTTVAANMFSDAALLGFGPGSFGSQVVRFLGQEDMGLAVGVPETAAVLIGDVNWVSILGQFGLVGVGAYAGALLAVHKMARNRVWTDDPFVSGPSLALVALVPAIVVLGFFGPNLEVRQVSFYFWLVAGIVASMGSREWAVAEDTSEPISV